MNAMKAQHRIPRLVVGGVASGVGKTTAVVALARALQAQGLRVALFKCGPDYLDPTYHRRATDGPVHNLDGWMMGRQAVRETFVRAAAGSDIALVEGVMGLFDGASPVDDSGSTAQIAKWLEAPVLLVVDAAGMARSVAALVQGYAGFDPGLRVAGALCNGVGSRGHLDLLRQALRKPPVMGGFPKSPELSFPERHLGLFSADDTVSAAVFDAWGRQAEAWLDLPAVRAAAESASPLPSAPAPPQRRASRCRIAVAHDAAFHFYYEDNLARLEQLGAELVRFSPVHDRTLPPADGIYLGGGYPEAAAPELAENRAMQEAMRGFAAAGGPVYAECGGLMYLTQSIRRGDEQRHPMVGLIPAETVVRERLQALGYVEVETRSATVLGEPGLRFRGHQFRYSELEMTGEPERAYSVRRRRGEAAFPEGFKVGSVLASYVHAHWASNPAVAEGFVAACAAFRGRRA